MDPDLVGRREELGSLAGWLDEALGGASRLVLLVGEAGIGKTRLAEAMAAMARDRGALVAWGRAIEDQGAPAFWPWRQVVEQLGAPAVFDTPATADPEADRFARFEALAAAIDTAATDAGGLVVVLDDLHQADEPSLRVLAHVVARSEGVPLLVVATLRSTEADHAPGVAAVVDALRRLPSHRRIGLGGLDPAGVATLLGATETGPRERQLAELTGGNPLYVTELARHLAAGGDLDALPPSLREAIRVRLDARSAACAEALRMAAVTGRVHTAGVVSSALDRPIELTLDALDEGVRAGLIEPLEGPGRFRFVHALVRDAVESTLSASALPRAHRQVALALERQHETSDDQLAELARHWDAAAVLGEADVAAEWNERAAAAADRRLAWEEAARLYDRSVDLSGPEVDPLDRLRRMASSAAARLHSGDVVDAASRCLDAARAAIAEGRPDLAAEIVLLAEGRGGPALAMLREAALAALDHLSADEHALRTRLLAFLTGAAFYLDPTQMPTWSAAAADEARRTDDPLAAVAAARARQMVLMDASGAVERLELADRMGAAGRQLRRPTVAMWEPIWRIDALIELGRLPEALAELGALRRAADDAMVPIVRWHVARINALVAQVSGRFNDAIHHAEVARDLFQLAEDPIAARAMHLGFLVSVQQHTGFERKVAVGLEEMIDDAPAFLGDMPRLGPIAAFVGVGEMSAAQEHYDRLVPVGSWDPAPFMWAPLVCMRVMVAAGLGRLEDVAALLDVLGPHRGEHAVTAGGSLVGNGPVELWLGVGERALDRPDDAATDLRAAIDWARTAGARGFEVHATVELAEVLLEAGQADDARRVARPAEEAATELGMPPWAARAAAVRSNQPAAPSPLSPREQEVAALVAGGCTNKQVADRLYVSERTAQNHVQHILTKLGLTNRTQIAAWLHARSTDP